MDGCECPAVRNDSFNDLIEQNCEVSLNYQFKLSR
uniref:Uncharacterized protein n=1 Tax=Heterorhabditis bacteriophora TaxID=37862 RepID=A0A1I7X3Z3_HETBA